MRGFLPRSSLADRILVFLMSLKLAYLNLLVETGGVNSMYSCALFSDEICRQLAGLPSRRLRRSGQLPYLPCKQILEQQHRRPDAL
uniref:Uncharacterized protein n=1 Tax=Meleagris gallopavo TaxID=9103 RepID=G1NME4_MELGA